MQTSNLEDMALRDLLIFDLDETLVHATEVSLEHDCDFKVGPYHVYRRPFTDELLEFATQNFDLAVWSTSSSSYVDRVVRELFTKDPLKFAWSIDRCVQKVSPQTNDYVYIKDLRRVQRFGYTTDQIKIVDDSPEKIARQPNCHIHVRPFFGERHDEALLDVLCQLKNLKAKSM